MHPPDAWQRPWLLALDHVATFLVLDALVSWVSQSKLALLCVAVEREQQDQALGCPSCLAKPFYAYRAWEIW